jgi:catalase
MTAPHQSPAFGSLAFIAVVIAASAAAFAYTAGWFSPQRLTPGKLVAAFAPPTGVALGHRRNHAKGICFTGVFEANGAGSELSRAPVFARGEYPVLGRFNLEPQIRTRRTRPSGCVAWEYGSRRRTDKNGGVP